MATSKNPASHTFDFEKAPNSGLFKNQKWFNNEFLDMPLI